MSWETQAWAGRQRPGRPADKLVLLGLASCADANHCAHPSVNWLAAFGDLDRKTVNTALRRLEEAGLISWTGARKGRTMQVKVYRLATVQPEQAEIHPLQSDAESDPKTELFLNRNTSTFSDKQAQKRATEPFLEPDSPTIPSGMVTPSRNLRENGKGGDDAPAAPAPVKATRLPADWAPPPIDDLPPQARALVLQWPSGAYQAVCETFRLHWAAESGARAAKRDWGAALGKWLVNDHGKVMRDARAGVNFAQLAPASGGGAARVVHQPVDWKRHECLAAEQVHRRLAAQLGQAMWAQWLAPCAIAISEAPIGDATVICPSEFVRGWVEERFGATIRDAVADVTGGKRGLIQFKVQQRREQTNG